MLIDERRHLIAEAVIAEGAATVADLSQRFSVSHVTIRSDLESLEQQGKLRRNRGGAVANRIARFRPQFQEETSVNLDPKRAIAGRAIKAIGHGDRVLLDAGSTTLLVAEGLLGCRATVAVNSVYSMNRLAEAPDVQVIVIGGEIYPPALSFVGPMAEEHIGLLHFDLVLLGANGVSPRGVSVNNLAEVGVKQRMVAAGHRIMVLADSSKLGLDSLSRFAPLDAIDELITDAGADPAVLDRLRESHPGLEVTLA